MDDESLIQLVTNLINLPKETETVEFKENNYDKDNIGKRISALSNSANLHDRKNAHLVFGIKDNTHEVIGTHFLPSQEKVGNEDLIFWLSKQINPSIDFRVYEFKFNNLPIVIIEIPPATTQPVKFNEIPYIRVGTATPKLIDYPEKESKIWNKINKNNFEKGIAKENLSVPEVLELLDYSKYFSLTGGTFRYVPIC